MRQLSLAGVLLILSASFAAAEPKTKASLTLERHATSNALDGPVELFDRYSSLRGSVEHERSGGAGSVKLGFEASAQLYDSYSFEDDAAAGVVAVLSRKLSSRVEIRGTFGLKHASEGDDLLIGNLIVPIRTDTTTLSAAGEAGIDLGGGYALVLAAIAAREDAGPTRFAGGLTAALEADTTRLGASAAVRRTEGKDITGGEILWRGVEPELAAGVQVAFRSDEIAAKGELRRALAENVELQVVAGAGWFGASQIPFAVVRPLYEAALKANLGKAELRASVFAKFETADTDDPLGSYVRRGQIEAGYRLTERLAAGGGAFLELKENFLLGYDERSWGIYSEAAWTISPKLALLFRVEYDRTRYSSIGLPEETLDAFVRLSAKTS